jgi:hypothetical protein
LNHKRETNKDISTKHLIKPFLKPKLSFLKPLKNFCQPTPTTDSNNRQNTVLFSPSNPQNITIFRKKKQAPKILPIFSNQEIQQNKHPFQTLKASTK